MKEETAEKLEEFFRALAGAHDPLLLLDYDGDAGAVSRGSLQGASVGGRAGAADAHSRNRDGRGWWRLPGRPAAEIAPLLGLETRLEVWGLHGAERLLPDGRRELERVPAATGARLDEVRALLREDSFGGLFEDKANGAVVHWRGVAARKAREIERRVRELFLPVTAMEGVTLLEFEAGLELRTGRDKGGAVGGDSAGGWRLAVRLRF